MRGQTISNNKANLNFNKLDEIPLNNYKYKNDNFRRKKNEDSRKNLINNINSTINNFNCIQSNTLSSLNCIVKELSVNISNYINNK